MSNKVWKRRKDLLYLGSFHGGDIPEFYGLTGDHLGTDAIRKYPLILIAVANEGFTSQLHQPPQPQPPEGFYSLESTIGRHLAQIHAGKQKAVTIQ